MVGFEHSKQFHVFELTRQLPKFAMYAVQDDFSPPEHLMGPITIDDNTSYVSFRLNERYQRLCLWINQVRQKQRLSLTVGDNIEIVVF